MASSCLCTLLWGAILIWYAAEGRNIGFPLIVTALFTLCAVSEIKVYIDAQKARKTRNKREQKPTKEDGKKA